MELMLQNKLVCGDVIETLQQMPAEIISCVMTSVPYWQQKDYKVKGQIGLEKTYQEWLEKMWLIMDEIWRVLRKDGTVWVNLGDKYGGLQGKNQGWQDPKAVVSSPRSIFNKLDKSLLFLPERFAIGCIERGWTIPNKNIWHKPNPMPFFGKGRFTNTWEHLYFMVKNTKPIFWIHRYTAEMVDKKPKDKTKITCPECEGSGTKDVTLWNDSLFPETAQVECSECKDRGEVSIWRSEDYYFDLDAVRRPHKENSYQRINRPIKAETMYADHPGYHKQDHSDHTWLSPAGKNPGDVITTKQDSVPSINAQIYEGFNRRYVPRADGANPGDFWSISTQSSKLPHYASYPEKLCEIPIKAGCPKWICKECGMARVRVTNKPQPPKEMRNRQQNTKMSFHTQQVGGDQKLQNWYEKNPPTTLGWSFCSCLCSACGKADCKCGEKWRPGIVLDPFVGIGTTCIVAKKQGRDYIGIDLKQKYVDIAKKRLKDIYAQEEIDFGGGLSF